MEERPNIAFAACSQFNDELGPYLEGEARPFITSHSRDCVSCAALLADLQSIRQAAQVLPMEDPPAAMWASLRAKLQLEGALGAPACSQFDAGLEAYMEGEPNPFIESHAQSCAPCGALMADLQAVREAARDLPLQEPSNLVWANLRVKLEAEGVLCAPACTQFNAGLEAYLEGEASPFIVTHAQDCAPCGALLADMQAIRQAAWDLPLEEPSRVVWANVRSRLEAEGAFREPVSGWGEFLSWRFLHHAMPAAVLAVLIMVGSALIWPSGNMQSGGSSVEISYPHVVTQMASAIPSGEDGTLAHVVADLESSFKANEASMSPDLKATYEKSLVSLDGSIKECLDSLQHEPRNTLAHDYLLAAYTSKAEVLSSALEFDGR